MSVHILTNSPNALLLSFKKAILEKKILTWSSDADGDFTHATEQWRNLAWFRPELRNDRLVLSIIKPTNSKISSVVYAIYHGRIIESMLAHFDKNFSNAFATALPSDKDNVGQ